MEEDQIGGLVGIIAGLYVGMNWKKITKFMGKQQVGLTVALVAAKEKIEDSIAAMKAKKGAAAEAEA